MKKQVSFFAALICIFSIFSANSLLAKGNSLKAPSTDLKNFHEFSRNVFRGAQPTKEGFNKLKKLGIKTIIDLVPNHTDEKLIEGLGFSYYQIPVKPWRLEDAGVIQFPSQLLPIPRTTPSSSTAITAKKKPADGGCLQGLRAESNPDHLRRHQGMLARPA